MLQFYEYERQSEYMRDVRLSLPLRLVPLHRQTRRIISTVVISTDNKRATSERMSIVNTCDSVGHATMEIRYRMFVL